MKKLIISIAFLTSIILSGCGDEEAKKTKTVKTVDYYMQDENEKECTATLKECKNNPGELGFTPNCINASRASMQKRRMKKDTLDYTGAFGD